MNHIIAFVWFTYGLYLLFKFTGEYNGVINIPINIVLIICALFISGSIYSVGGDKK